MTAARVIRFPLERTRPEPLVDLRAVMDHYGVSEYGHPADAGARARNLALWEQDVTPLRAVDVRKRESA